MLATSHLFEISADAAYSRSQSVKNRPYDPDTSGSERYGFYKPGRGMRPRLRHLEREQSAPARRLQAAPERPSSRLRWSRDAGGEVNKPSPISKLRRAAGADRGITLSKRPSVGDDKLSGVGRHLRKAVKRLRSSMDTE